MEHTSTAITYDGNVKTIMLEQQIPSGYNVGISQGILNTKNSPRSPCYQQIGVNKPELIH